MDAVAHTQAEREAVMEAVAESFGACSSVTADRVLDALAGVRATTYQGAVEERDRLRRENAALRGAVQAARGDLTDGSDLTGGP